MAEGWPPVKNRVVLAYFAEKPPIEVSSPRGFLRLRVKVVKAGKVKGSETSIEAGGLFQPQA